MKKRVVAIDIDDVLFPFIPTLVQHYNSVAGTKLTSTDFFTYHLSEVFGINEEEANDLVATFLQRDFVYLKPVTGSKEALGRLKKDFSVVLVTARNGIFEPGTRQWLAAHFDELFDDLIFAGNPYDCFAYREKGDICRELDACLLIDDSPHNLISAIDNGVDAILFGHHPWNKIHDLPVEVPRCKGWDEVLDVVYASEYARIPLGKV